jgi:hypothetical protein
MRGARALSVAITTLALAMAVSGCGAPMATTSTSPATTVATARPLDVFEAACPVANPRW